MSTFADRFKAGADIASNLINTYYAAKQRGELEDIANAKPEQIQGFTQAQATQLGDAASAGADVTPQFKEDGTFSGYTVTPKLADGEMGPPVPKVVATQGLTEFMGNRTPGTLSESQISNARQRAMAGVLMKTDPLAGQRMMRDVTQAEQADAMFALNKKSAERADRLATKDEEYQNGRQEVFNSSIFGQKNALFAKQYQDYTQAKQQYDQALASGKPPQELGLPPQAPSRPAYSIADSLADQGTLLTHDAKYGKVDAKTFGDFTERLRKVEDEGYLKALNLAQGGGSIEKVLQAFNSTGTMKLDPKNVVSDSMVPGQGGVPERVITYKDDQGNTQTINVMSELKSLGKAHDALSQFYQGKADARGDKELALHENKDKREGELLPLQKSNLGATTAHTIASTGVLNQILADRKELDEVRTELNTAIDNNDEAGIKTGRAKLMNYMMSGRSGMQNMSPEERKANFYLASGAAKDMKEAAKMSHEKVQPSLGDIFLQVSKPNSMGMAPDEKYVDSMMSAFGGSDWKAKLNPNPSAGGPAKGSVVNGYEFQGGDPNNKYNWKKK